MDSSRISVILLLLCLLAQQVQGEGKGARAETYRAAVVQYAPLMQSPAHIATRAEAIKIMSTNLQNFEQYISSAKANKSQIVVFPEYGLTGPSLPSRAAALPYLEAIPCPHTNPCLTGQPSLTPISVSKYQIVVVANYGDIQACSVNCPEDGHFQFNTQVAFSEDGTILGKYHKIHLYYEPQFDPPPVPTPVVFTTSFGVRFGMMVCFDIMFDTPQLAYVEELGVRDIVFSSWWVNTPPLLTATQIQYAWSYAFEGNMLGTAGGTGWATTGFGIFSNGALLASKYNTSYLPSSSMLIADVPILERPQNRQSTPPPLPPIENATPGLDTQILHLAQGTPADVTLSNADVACRLQGSISDGQPMWNESFAFFVVSGYLTPLFPVIGCGLVHCQRHDSADCVSLLGRDPTLLVKTSFATLELQATFSSSVASSVTVFPAFSKNEAQLMSETEVTYARPSSGGTTHRLSLSKPNPVLNFSLLGRQLNKS